MDIIKTIQKIASQNQIKLDVNNLNTNLKDIGIDSLAMMNLIFKIEEELGVTIDDEKLVNIKNLNDLVKALEEAKK